MTRNSNPQRAKTRLKMRAAILDVKEKRMKLQEQEKAMRRQLKST